MDTKVSLEMATNSVVPDELTLPRALNGGDNGDHQSSYLFSADGGSYDPYAVAWRYLGMYIDCDVNGAATGDSNGDQCSRKLLWAAYYDPEYMYAEIGEYQFYDWRNNKWDTSTCKTSRCAKMDCHAENTHFELVGIFKETDGLVDWAEQLIKHEGYCVWKDVAAETGSMYGGGDENDVYEYMHSYQEKWAYGCQITNVEDKKGNVLYQDITPLPNGNITSGLYLDSDCSQKSSMTYEDYILKYYKDNYNSEAQGKEVASQWKEDVALWNEMMQDFKICQPCRAYSKFSQYGQNQRSLNDGEGDDELWGFNCYDDADYQNVNQCYKFEVRLDCKEVVFFNALWHVFSFTLVIQSHAVKNELGTSLSRGFGACLCSGDYLVSRTIRGDVWQRTRSRA
jgi:hypothetical protein